ncbi:hypothetical protein PMZ80_004973 [Knufia obscura]|uniref:Uncharacterized protein n=2 Tax=Knufia TaxID=430999 RepID=A0AAN8IBC9_9EURO|nr:hypothetical protein PMZ80_004973 [Knufia obscura]KAK5957636.1 hypothetical protein OHC33_000824 [Knufia fluminis]
MAKSALGSILPLVITFILLAVVAVVGFVAYQIACDVADKTSKKMEKKNVSFSKDGLKVGVKEVSAEQVGDSTQNVLMKAWNTSSWPAYQSKLGWGSASPAGSPVAGSEKRKP